MSKELDSEEMRPIKFRAWTGKKMMYQDNQYLASFIRRVVLQICLEHGSTQQHESYLPNGGDISEYLQHFTGLKDKQGKEIYEGDTVLWCGGQYDIKFSDIEGTWILKDDREDWECPSLYAIRSPQQSRIEIIGNMYEHSELLKKVNRS